MPTEGRPPHDAASPLDAADVDELLKELKAVSRHLQSDETKREVVDVSPFARPLYLTLGCLSVSIGTIGIFIPGLPTTVFMIVALWLSQNHRRK